MTWANWFAEVTKRSRTRTCKPKKSVDWPTSTKNRFAQNFFLFFTRNRTKLFQVEKLNARLRASKRTADEAEEETTRVNGLKRKLQRDLDEATEQIESIQRELQAQRNKAR